MKYVLVAAFVSLGFFGHASAETYTYRNTKGKLATFTGSARSMSGPAGSIRNNAYGNATYTLKGARFSPHNGWAPSTKTVKKGYKWVHNFTAAGKARRRTCRVSKVGTVRVKAGSFKGFVVKCDNQLLSAQRPNRETITFRDDRLFLKYKSSDRGSSELVKIGR